MCSGVVPLFQTVNVQWFKLLVIHMKQIVRLQDSSLTGGLNHLFFYGYKMNTFFK